MAAVFRIGLAKIIPIQGTKLLPDVVITHRFISGKAFREGLPQPKKPDPYPYKTKRYGLFHRIFDKTSARMDENSKLLVVEGPIAAGKTEFAKTLADDLGMLYLPEANLDMLYINDYGFDMRTLDPKLPKSTRSFDVHNFCCDPCNRNTAQFQLMMYIVRYSQYVDALAHIFSTGQGVVLDRCAYSDFVFMEAMHSQRFISRGARSVYNEVKENTIHELLHPHLVIYLDVPVSKVKENIKARNIPYEVNSPALTDEYLTSVEKYYKENYLKEISVHSELLVYDWTNKGDAEVVVEDIERIDFTKYTKHDKKMADWAMLDEEEWAITRNKFADNKNDLLNYFNVPRVDVPELLVEAEDLKATVDIYDTAPGYYYKKGFNADVGDTGLLFKFDKYERNTLPIRERKIVC